MTRNDFKELIYIKRRLADLKERLKELRDAAERITSDLSGMPHCSGDHDKMASYAASVELGGCEVKRCWFCGQEINLNKLKGEKENEKD